MVRQDLSGGEQLAQAVHAAFKHSQDHPVSTGRWHRGSQYLVILAAADEASLRVLMERATKRGIAHTVWTEPDLHDEVTAVVFEPGQTARRLCSNLPLALRQAAT